MPARQIEPLFHPYTHPTTRVRVVRSRFSMWLCMISCIYLSCFTQSCLSGYYGGSSHSSPSYNDEDYSGYDSGPFLPSIPGIGMALGPNELQSLLSSFGMTSIDKIPAVAEHVYGSPQKVSFRGELSSESCDEYVDSKKKIRPGFAALPIRSCCLKRNSKRVCFMFRVAVK